MPQKALKLLFLLLLEPMWTSLGEWLSVGTWLRAAEPTLPRPETLSWAQAKCLTWIESQKSGFCFKPQNFRVFIMPYRLFLVPQWWRICLPMQETWVWSLGQENSLEEEMALHFSILAWKIPWIEEPGRIQSVHWVAESRIQLSYWTHTHTHVLL